MTVRVSRPLLKAELDAVNKLITPADETERIVSIQRRSVLVWPKNCHKIRPIKEDAQKSTAEKFG